MNVFSIDNHKVLKIRQAERWYYGENEFQEVQLKVARTVAENNIEDYKIELVFFVTVEGEDTKEIPREMTMHLDEDYFISDVLKIDDEILCGVGQINVLAKFTNLSDDSVIGFTGSKIIDIFDKITNTTAIVTPGGGGGGDATIVKVDGTSITSGGTANIRTTGNYSTSNPLSTKEYTDNKVDNHHDAEKQDVITDLFEIRSGASLGSTAVQDSNYVHTDNNYTDTEKAKLSALENYDDTEIWEAVNEQGVEVARLGTSKQDTITDLENIRSGASKGETSVQLTGEQNIRGTKTFYLSNSNNFFNFLDSGVVGFTKGFIRYSQSGTSYYFGVEGVKSGKTIVKFPISKPDGTYTVLTDVELAEHNNSGTTHQDIRNDIINLQSQIGNIESLMANLYNGGGAV